MKTVYFIMLLPALLFWVYNAINLNFKAMWLSCAFIWIVCIGMGLDNKNNKQNQ